jgi:carbamoyltransferase
MSIYVLGINSVYHESSVCLIKDGEIIVAVEEERFNRKKHGKHPTVDNPHLLPFDSIDYCLREANISFKDISQIGFSFNPIERLAKNIGLEKNVVAGDWGSTEGEQLFYKLNLSIPKTIEDRYKTELTGKWNWIPHHICHAASAFYASPFEDAAVLTVDGIGEFESIMFGYGKGYNLSVIKFSGAYPNSLGFLWTKASSFLNFTEDGFGEYGAGKVMALAAYGEPDRFYSNFKKFVKIKENSELEIDGSIVQFREGKHDQYEKLFGFKAREIDQDITQEHKDFAATLQKINNEVMLEFTNYLFSVTKAKKLCTAGGVSLNCTTNAYILEHSSFENIFIQPGANDMGTAIGAACYTYHQIMGNKKRVTMKTPYLGPKYSDNEILIALEERRNEIDFVKLDDIENNAACLLAEGRIIAWFQDRLEFGPRALGNRSLLADPRNPNMKKLLSEEIKGREWFRPLAPIVLEEDVDQWFVRPKKGAEADKWMLMAYTVKVDKRNLIPSAIHHDNTGRVQVVNTDTNKKIYKLVNEYKKITGIPVILNTSFNIREPIVCTPKQAISTFINSGVPGIDILVIENYFVVKKASELKLSEIEKLCFK